MSFESSIYNRGGMEEALAEIEALDGPAEKVSADEAGGFEVDNPSSEGVTSEAEDADPEPSAQTGEEHPEDGPPATPEHPEAGPPEPADTGYLGGKYPSREAFEAAHKSLQAEFTRSQQAQREMVEYIGHMRAQQQTAIASPDQLPPEQQQALYDEAERRGIDPATLFYLKQQESASAHAYQRNTALAEMQRTLTEHPLAEDPELIAAIAGSEVAIREIYALPPDRMPARMQDYVEGHAARIELGRLKAELPKMQAAWKKQGADEAVKRQQSKRAGGELASGGSTTARSTEPRPRGFEDELIAAHRTGSSALPWQAGFGKS